MRRRSNTIQADSYQEFFEISIAQSPEALVSDPSALMESPYCYLPSSAKENVQLSHFPSQNVFNIQKIYACSADTIEEEIDDVEAYLNCTPSTDTGSTQLSAGTDSLFSNGDTCMAKFLTSDADGGSKREEETNGALHKVMVVGGTGTGRHSVINSYFNEERSEKSGEPKLRNSLDLLIRSKKENGCTQRFKFWIRDTVCQRFDPLIKVYYKSINHYIFIYDSGDKSSFECLDRAIREVMAEVPRSKFRGLLIANNSKVLQDQAVTKEEGERLQRSYGLDTFVEINNLDEDIKSFDNIFKEFFKLI